MVRTGAYVTLAYGVEGTFNTPAITIDKAFGLEQKITSWSYTNSRMTLQNLGTQLPVSYAYGQTMGRIGFEFVLSNPWIHTLLAGSDPSTTGVSPTFTHTWALGAVTDASHDLTTGTDTIVKEVKSFTSDIEMKVTNAPLYHNRQITGAVLGNFSVSSSIGNYVRASTDILYASEISEDGATQQGTVGTDSENFPYTFAHGTLKANVNGGGKAVVGEIQDFDLNISPNQELLWTHGNHEAVTPYRKMLDISGSLRASWASKEWTETLYRQTSNDGTTLTLEEPEIQMIFANEDNSKRIIYTLQYIGYDDLNISIEPNEPVFFNVNYQARRLEIKAINGTSTQP